MISSFHSTPRLRLLYVITVASCGGAQTHVLELLRAAAPRFSVGLATGQDGFLADEARRMGIPVFIVPGLVVPVAPMQDCRALAALIRITREFRPDLIHAHSSKAGILARAAARVCGVVSVFTAHGWAFADGLPWPRRFIALACEHAILPCSDVIITVSEYDRRLALRHGLVPRGGVYCVQNGIADDPIRAEPANAGTPLIAMVARFCPQKDHSTLVRALAGLRQGFRLALIGGGEYLERLRSEVVSAGIEDRTDFLGERTDIPQLLGRAHVFALISNYEGLPISILEAMRAGLPIVASDVGGVREIVRDGVNGFLVPHGDPAALRERLRLLLEAPALRARMGARSRNIYEQELTAERMIEGTLAVYAKVLARNSLASAGTRVRWRAVSFKEQGVQ